MALTKNDATATIKKPASVLVVKCGKITKGTTYKDKTSTEDSSVILNGKLDWDTGLTVKLSGLKKKTRILKSIIGTPSAMNANWRVAFSKDDNSITIFGQMEGSNGTTTTLTLYVI